MLKKDTGTIYLMMVIILSAIVVSMNAQNNGVALEADAHLNDFGIQLHQIFNDNMAAAP